MLGTSVSTPRSIVLWNNVEEANKIIVTESPKGKKKYIYHSLGAMNQMHTALKAFSLLLLKFSKCSPFPSLP